jgi:hypothetical protein
LKLKLRGSNMASRLRTFARVCLIAIAALFLCHTVRAELDLTAELSPTVGLDGFSTYRITVSSDLGNIVGYDFSTLSYGITGPLSQINPFQCPTIFQDSIFAGGNPAQDSHFLFNCRDVVNLFPSESSTSLHTVFALRGDMQYSIGNSVPFLQLVTNSAADVQLNGSLVIRRPDDSLVELAINSKLSDVTIGAAPNLSVLPVPPPQPVVVTPPVVQPPVQPQRPPEPNPLQQPSPLIPPPTTVVPPLAVTPPIETVPPGVFDPADPSALPVDPSLTIDPVPVEYLPRNRVYLVGENGQIYPIDWVPSNIYIDGDILRGAPTLFTTNELPPPNGGSYGYVTAYTNGAGVLNAAPNGEIASAAGLSKSLTFGAKLLDATQPVPEPTTTLLASITVVAASGFRRR